MRLLITFLSCVISLQCVAGHLIGGEISYECLGGGQYAIALKMYRDCYAAGPNVVTSFDDVVNVSVYEAVSNNILDTLQIPKPNDSTLIPLILNIPCLDNPPDLCVVGMEYRDTINLVVPPGGIHLVNQRCCRTPDALNIINPSDYGSTYHAFIPDPNIAPCNSSPTFNQVPPIALCTQIYLDLDYSATDKDGDSLVYSLCRPYHGGGNGQGTALPVPAQPSPPPFQNVVWSTGFDDQYQIPAAPAFEIDSATGIIRGRPNMLGTYVFAVRVEEYRNGILIGENRRDFQMTTVFCEVQAAAAIDSVIEECIGLEIQFFNISTIGKSFEWDFGDTLTSTDTSRVDNPNYTYPDTGLYTIRLIAKGDICADTTYLDYYVKPRLKPAFEPPEMECLDVNKFNLEADGVYYPTTAASWTLMLPGVEDSTRNGLSSGRFSGSEAGTFPVTLMFEDFGCEKFYTDSVIIIPNPDFSILTENPNDCVPMSTSIYGIPEQAYHPWFEWAFDGDTLSGDSVTFPLDSAAVYDLWVEMKTDSACIDTISKFYPRHITALDTPQAVFMAYPDEAGMYEPYFEVQDASIDARKVEFLLDDSVLFRSRYFPLDLPDTGNHQIRLVATHASGCTDTTYRTIRTEPVYQFWAPNAFTPDADGRNEGWKASVFVWEEYDLYIYDRWGQPVFITHDPTYEWNGRKYNSGPECPIGTYAYKARVIDNNERELFYDGVIFLLR